MLRMFPYDISTGAMGIAGAWVNEDIDEDIEGSIPPAEFYEQVGDELANFIESQGLILDGTKTQLQTAVILSHTVSENRTIVVPAEMSLKEAVNFASSRIIPTGVTLTIALEAGPHYVNTTTGELLISIPFGDSVVIEGATMTGSFPTGAEVNNATPSVTQGVIEARWATKVYIQGAVRAGFFFKNGMLKEMRRIAFIGDGTVNQHGVMLGEWNNECGQAAAKITDCWFHRCGADGLRANFNCAVQGQRLGASHNTWCGFRIANQSGMQVSGSWISVRNTQDGVMCYDMGFGEFFDGVAYFCNNTGAGLAAGNNSTYTGFGGICTHTIQGNGGGGIVAYNMSFIIYRAATATGNTTADVTADSMSLTHHVSPVSVGVFAPAVNTVGNNQSLNRQ